ncbi:ABC transporter ATP-binding protein [Mycolicibacterium litorale]|uniref:ABC transporter ATP-binding protein n=1 Tax=Mycolicibacterium litorale TaxID=758802 RepID=UPI003CF70EC1
MKALGVEVDRFRAWYPTAGGPRMAVENLTLEVRRGEFVALIGPSGCGKSTLLRALAGLHPKGCSEGTLHIGGATVDDVRRNREIAFMFQRPALLPWRTLRENVRIPLQTANVRRPAIDPEEMLEMVGLADYADALPRECSGGMQQRAAIARSLILAPSLLLMDEPFGALDEMTRERLNRVLLQIWEKSSCTVLFVTHSLEEAVFLADRVVVLSERPARLKGTVPITLPRDRDPEIRRTAEFLALENEIRDLLYHRDSPDYIAREVS